MYLQLLEEAYASSFCFRKENTSFNETINNISKEVLYESKFKS